MREKLMVIAVRVIGIFLIVVSIVTLVMCWNYNSYLQLFQDNAEQTTGTIAEVIEDHSGDAPSFSFVFSFVDSSGKQHRIKSDIGSLHKPEFKVGQKVQVLYPLSMPEEARIDTFRQMYTRLIVSILFGMACFILGVYFILKPRISSRSEKQKEPSTQSSESDLYTAKV